MPEGTVKWFRKVIGFGFIIPDEPGKDVYVHLEEVRKAGMHLLNTGDRIRYTLAREGRRRAVNLALLGVDAFNTPVFSGVLVSSVPHRGFAFIAPDDGGARVFVHFSALRAAGINTEAPCEGTRLQYRLSEDGQGRLRAVSIERAPTTSAPRRVQQAKTLTEAPAL